eukprot:TRINITY_DN19946_c0_g1_i1.p1 TRINITY_DN19946_c0_g1~~TRINITY_DN19946_c0_g1_i1.p1  ORF type:complete len:183 (-),score=37.16 TRINITY_DN19946_c0_g1_i1:119-667(-)
MLRTLATVSVRAVRTQSMVASRTLTSRVITSRAITSRAIATPFVRAMSSKIEAMHPDFQPKKTDTAAAATEKEPSFESALADIKKTVEGNDVVIYMKGYPDAPQCGFSRTACLVLDTHDVEFTGVNVLESPVVREGIKKYTNWPTIPQIFVKGEFIGGCDILLEMHRDGSLDKLLRTHSLKK